MSDNEFRTVGLTKAARTGLAGLGPIGRSALFGLALSAAVAVVLGFVIPRAVQSTLLDAETDLLSGVVRSGKESGLVELLTGDDDALDGVHTFVDDRLLGGRTVRVKIINAAGSIVYSDLHDLIGQQYRLSESAKAVLGGSANAIELDSEESESEQGLGALIEFVIPVESDAGEVVGLFEIYQPTDILAGEVADIRRTVWIAIGSGLGLAAIFTALLTVASGRQTLRQFRRSELLLEGLLRAEEEERKRVVGALHNEVGQPLYRILFGLQATRRHLGDDHPDAAELTELERLARTIDKTLRSEFNLLYRPASEDETLAALMGDLVTRVSNEMPGRITSEIDLDLEPTASQREAIYRAAEEALANIRRHAHAGSVWVRLAIEDHRLVLTVEDDGVGSPSREGIGLLSTRERLEAIGGGLKLRSKPTVGTLLTAWVPYDEESRS